MSFFGIGGSGAQLSITVTPPVDQNGSKLVRLTKAQKWKAHKNPYHQFHYFAEKLGKMGNAPQVIGGSQVVPEGGYGGYPPLTTGSEIYAYDSNTDVEGVITLMVPPGKKIEHMGLRVEFVGRIETENLAFEGRPHHDFISMTKEIEPPTAIYDPSRSYPFRFGSMDKVHETYHGKHVSVKYLIRVSMERKFLPPLTKEHEIIVQSVQPEMARVPDEKIKMEVGIEDCLHIEFEYDRRHYHLEDVIHGRVNFLLVRIKIKHMELAVMRRETTGTVVASEINEGGGPQSGGNAITETQVLCKHEVMDGAPIKGEVIPVRLFLAGIPADLTPTYPAGSNTRFSVRYFLNLVLVDEEDRRYFKQQEIILWRKRLG